MRRKTQWSEALTKVVEKATKLEPAGVLKLVQELDRSQTQALAKELGINTKHPKASAFLTILVSEGIYELARGSVTIVELRDNPPQYDIPDVPDTMLDLTTPKPRLQLPLGRTALTAR